ncbi:MAG: M48 family metallopeptidase [Flavobacteriaceae bacterium]
MIIYYVVITIIIVDYLFNTWLNTRNHRASQANLPDSLKDIYDAKEYKKSMDYQAAKYKVTRLSGLLSLVVSLIFILAGGFKWLNDLVYSFEFSELLTSLLFFALLGMGSYIINLPFSYYKTFKIESEYGFNLMTKKTFWMDQFKGSMLTIVLGGVVLSLVIFIYQNLQEDFWWLAWILISLISVFITFFYSSLIVPLFNKQIPLEDGELKSKITELSEKLKFNLDNIFVIDGSKRSTKANAYFSGFGAKKRIVLFDTLINDLDTDEILAVLAHEIGHYKKKHVVINMLLTMGLTGVMLWVFSLLVGNDLIAQSFGIESANFHIGLVIFSFLYQPISELTGIGINYLSRQFEYQADNFAKHCTRGEDLIESLKKLSRKSLSNLTPDSVYEFVHYSHPNLEKRIKALKV